MEMRDDGVCLIYMRMVMFWCWAQVTQQAAGESGGVERTRWQCPCLLAVGAWCWRLVFCHEDVPWRVECFKYMASASLIYTCCVDVSVESWLESM